MIKKSFHYFLDLIGFKLNLVSSEQIISWTLRKFQDTIINGEVSEPVTLNFLKGYAEPNGLFCERIFGPLVSWKCLCGKFDYLKNIIYDKKQLYFCKTCGLELNNKNIRRYRIGYILLNTPIVHNWFFKDVLPLFLDYSTEILESIIYYKTILNEKTVFNIDNTALNTTNKIYLLFATQYIQKILKNINLLNEYIYIQERLLNEKFYSKRKYLLKKAKILHLFFINNIKPYWILLDVLPVIPPGIRPFFQLPNNTFILSPLNIIYKQIITRNNRLLKWIGMKNFIPIIFEIIEKQNIQFSIDLLLKKNINNKINNTYNMSLTKQLSGKFGRFRQNILGKRIDFTGRSVIISGQDLILNELGISSSLASDLYQPLLFNILKNHKKLNTLFKAFLISQYLPIFIKLILNKLFKSEILIINRAPTLHKMNLQAFIPRLVENNILKLYPIACSKFNADFDGDQMGIFMTISLSVKKETKNLLALDKNIFSSATGYNIHKPSLSMILGLYSMLNFKNLLHKKIILQNIDDVLSTYSHNLIKLQTPIWFKYTKTLKKSKQLYYINTIVGKLLLQLYLQII